jgi:Phosphate-induced protein 1 conserved region
MTIKFSLIPAAIAVVTASLFALAGTIQAAEVRHQEGEHLRPTGKGWGELDPTGQSSRHATAGSNGIYYHGGPVMLGTPNVYFIWYGNWSGNTATSILPTFVGSLFGSPYLNINSTYYNGSGSPVSNQLTYARSTTDNYSHGTVLSDSAVESIVASALSSGALRTDINGMYFVLTSADVNESSGFCRRYCAWHTKGTINGQDIKFGFVGNPDRCPFACEQQTSSPNDNAGADGMANLLAHEISEILTDPDLNAWYDRRGSENGDKCAWNFGTTQTASNGSQYNVTLGNKQYLLQKIWANASGGYCAIQYPPGSQPAP